MTLVSAVPGDGKLGSTPLSGASIDPEKETTDITIKASDHPYGKPRSLAVIAASLAVLGFVKNFSQVNVKFMKENIKSAVALKQYIQKPCRVI